MKPKSFAAELVEEFRDYAYKLDWTGTMLDTVVGIVRKVELRRKSADRRRARRVRAGRGKKS